MLKYIALFVLSISYHYIPTYVVNVLPINTYTYICPVKVTIKSNALRSCIT